MHMNKYEQVDQFLTEVFDLDQTIQDIVLANNSKHDLPAHDISLVQGQLLHFLVQMVNAKRIVEFGTLGGFSTIILARAMGEDAKVFTIEKNKDFAEVAKNNIKLAKCEDKVEMLVGDAVKMMNQIESKNIDMVFLDADKSQYIDYVDWSIQHVRSGGIIVADNIIRDGEVVNHQSSDPKAAHVRKFLHYIAHHSALTNCVLPLVGNKGFDGISISMCK